MINPVRSLRRKIVERMTASHLAGPGRLDALHVARQAAALGWPCTFGYWTGPQDTPRIVAQEYAAAVQLIGEQSLDCYLSVKVTALNYDPGFFDEVLALAGRYGFRIHCDAMDPDSADRTFSLIERALARHRNLGCTLPGRWIRSVEDAARVVEWGVPVRIVKGQWPDPSLPGYDARSGYLEVVRRLAGKAAQVAVATHDRHLAQQALRLLTDSGTPCEMEQLSSLPHTCFQLAEQFRVPFRLYVPYGYPSMPYDIWQVRARPQIVRWVIRDALRGKHRKLPARAVPVDRDHPRR